MYHGTYSNANTLPTCREIKLGVDLGGVHVIVTTLQQEIKMTTSEHMDDLAERYARALVRYHITGDRDDYNIVFELHEMLNSVCHEYAQEQLEGL